MKIWYNKTYQKGGDQINAKGRKEKYENYK